MSPVAGGRLRRLVRDPGGYHLAHQVFSGEMDAFLDGHGASMEPVRHAEPLIAPRSSAPTGQQATQPYRWIDSKFHAVVDRMAQVPPDDFSQLSTLFKQAMAIRIPALPDVGLVQCFHRIPTNHAFWTNWPDENNPYINTAFWHRTSPFWLYSIRSRAKASTVPAHVESEGGHVKVRGRGDHANLQFRVPARNSAR